MDERARRIQLRRTNGWQKPQGAVVVARPSKWGNPFRVRDRVALLDSTFSDMPIHETLITPLLAVELFRAYVWDYGWEAQIRDELAGKDLCCWCGLDLPCHADVLLELANGAAP